MRAKALKDWVAIVPDESIIEVREQDYGSFSQEFQMQAMMPPLLAMKEKEDGEVA